MKYVYMYRNLFGMQILFINILKKRNIQNLFQNFKLKNCDKYKIKK